MKKVSSIFLIMAFLCGLFFVPAKAISVNHCKVFQQAFYELQWYIDRYNNDIKENDAIPSSVILDYTYSNCRFSDNYGRGELGELGYESYAFPADYFESLAKKFFHVIKVEDLRNCLTSGFHGVKFDHQTNEYIGRNPSGWGGAAAYVIYGYTQNGENKYTTYGYLGFRTDEQDYAHQDYAHSEDFKGYIYTGDFATDGSKEILVIYSYLKSIISYNDNTVKFHSLETIYELPEKDDLITADTKVDVSASTSSSSSQNSMSMPTTTSLNQSPTSSTQNNTASNSATNIPSEVQSTTSNHSTATQSGEKASYIASSIQTTESEINSEENTRTKEFIESSTTSTDTEEKAKTKTKNDIWIIIMILIIALLIGATVICFWLIKKKNKDKI